MGLLPLGCSWGGLKLLKQTELLFPGQIICASTAVPRSALSSLCPARPQRPEIQQGKGATAHPRRRRRTRGPVLSISHATSAAGEGLRVEMLSAASPAKSSRCFVLLLDSLISPFQRV